MKHLFLTGGRGGIGSAMAHYFKSRGYTVSAPCSDELDLLTCETLETFITQLAPVDAFIHAAGFNSPKEFTALSLDDLEKTYQINTRAFFLLMGSLVRQKKFQPKPHILAISSIYGSFSRKRRFAYASSKHCLNGMVQSLALDQPVPGMVINALAPGFIDTIMTRKNNDSATIAGFERQIPLGRLGQPEELAKIAYFLCSEENSYIHGQMIIADGGYSVGGFQE